METEAFRAPDRKFEPQRATITRARRADFVCANLAGVFFAGMDIFTASLSIAVQVGVENSESISSLSS